MKTLVVSAAVRTRLGDDASEGLVQMFDTYHEIASERFEHHVTREVGAMRLQMHQGFSGIREEMASLRVDVLKWSLLFWVGQFAAVLGALSFMLGHR